MNLVSLPLISMFSSHTISSGDNVHVLMNAKLTTTLPISLLLTFSFLFLTHWRVHSFPLPLFLTFSFSLTPLPPSLPLPFISLYHTETVPKRRYPQGKCRQGPRGLFLRLDNCHSRPPPHTPYTTRTRTQLLRYVRNVFHLCTRTYLQSFLPTYLNFTILSCTILSTYFTSQMHLTFGITFSF